MFNGCSTNDHTVPSLYPSAGRSAKKEQSTVIRVGVMANFLTCLQLLHRLFDCTVPYVWISLRFPLRLFFLRL